LQFLPVKVNVVSGSYDQVSFHLDVRLGEENSFKVRHLELVQLLLKPKFGSKILFLRLKIVQGFEVFLFKNDECLGPLKLFSEHLDFDFTRVKLLAFFIVNFIEYFKRRLVLFCDGLLACVKIIFDLLSLNVKVNH
jgi:hypothetical protein